MAVSDVIVQIDAEIAKLQQVKALLSNGAEVALQIAKGKRGRPKGSANGAKPAAEKTGKRSLTSEARIKMAEAQRRRWAAVKAGK